MGYVHEDAELTTPENTHTRQRTHQTYAYYEITQPRDSVSRRDDLLVTATPMSGDPDLYLTLKDHLPFPDNGTVDLSSVFMFGAESTVLTSVLYLSNTQQGSNGRRRTSGRTPSS